MKLKPLPSGWRRFVYADYCLDKMLVLVALHNSVGDDCGYGVGRTPDLAYEQAILSSQLMGRWPEVPDEKADSGPPPGPTPTA